MSDTFLKVADTIKPFSTKLLIRKVNNFIKIGYFEKAHSLIKRFYNEQNLYDDLKDNPKILSYFSNILLTVFADYEGSLKLSLDSIKRFPKIEEGYKILAENYIYFYGDLLQGRKILIESINKFHSTLLAESYIKSFFLNNPKAGFLELIKLKKAGLFSKNTFKILYFNIMSFIGNLQSQLDSLMEIKDYIDEDQFDYERLSLNPSYINEISLDILQHKIKFVEDELSFELDHNNKKTLLNKLYYLKIIVARKFFKKKINDEFKFLEEAKEIYFKINFHCSTNHTPPIKIKSMPMTLFNDQNEYIELVKKNKLISYDYSPIFIIGLPRSGSTLIESIISGSKDIISCDESQIILKFKNYIKFINKKKSIMEMYINNFPEISNFKRFTDKSLNNFANIDLIIQLFPKAKFINCIRNPKENAIAIFKNNFDTLPWSLNIKSILKYMDEYFKLINHYKKNIKKKSIL